jgi:hypothetical protein
VFTCRSCRSIFRIETGGGQEYKKPWFVNEYIAPVGRGGGGGGEEEEEEEEEGAEEEEEEEEERRK